MTKSREDLEKKLTALEKPPLTAIRKSRLNSTPKAS